jgi:hypothetical protein
VNDHQVELLTLDALARLRDGEDAVAVVAEADALLAVAGHLVTPADRLDRPARVRR